MPTRGDGNKVKHSKQDGTIHNAQTEVDTSKSGIKISRRDKLPDAGPGDDVNRQMHPITGVDATHGYLTRIQT